MNSELIAVLDYYEKEKGIKREILVEALSSALLSASKKAVGPARELRIDIDPKNGTVRAMASLIAVERVSDQHDEIQISKVRRVKPDAEVGDVVDWEVTPANFGRIAAQTARQAIMQKIRQVEKDMIYDEFKDRAGEIVSGVVRRFDRSDVIVDIGKFEAIMPTRERVNTEEYAIGDRIRAYVVAVENGARGPEIIISRSHPNFVRRLFEVEVSEIADRTVELKAIAREAGHRTKVAVASADDKVDPVGACVGMKGARVKNIVRELNNEKVDIIRWSDDIREFVIEALKPAIIKSLEIDEAKHSIHVGVGEEQASQAIGRRGQNARLTSRLTGWDINIEKEEDTVVSIEDQKANVAHDLASLLEVEEEIANKLVASGLNSLEGIVTGADAGDLADILECNAERAQQIFDNAKREYEKNTAAL